MIHRLHKTTDIINADKRFLVCRIARKIENEKLLATNPTGWIKQLVK